jgi:hypothetical protein
VLVEAIAASQVAVVREVQEHELENTGLVEGICMLVAESKLDLLHGAYEIPGSFLPVSPALGCLREADDESIA